MIRNNILKKIIVSAVGAAVAIALSAAPVITYADGISKSIETEVSALESNVNAEEESSVAEENNTPEEIDGENFEETMEEESASEVVPYEDGEAETQQTDENVEGDESETTINQETDIKEEIETQIEETTEEATTAQAAEEETSNNIEETVSEKSTEENVGKEGLKQKLSDKPVIKAKAEAKAKKVSLSMPALKNCVSAKNGVKISWDAVKGAESYDIYWWNGSKKQWIKFASTKDTTYIDKAAKEGKKYYYTVAARAGDATSKYNYDGKIGVFLKGSKLKIKRGKDNKAELSWKAVNGAKGYRIYWRYPGEKKWRAYKWVTGTSYLDKVKYGKSYEYMVRAYQSYSSVNYMGYYEESYKAGFTLLETPKLASAKNGKKGLTVKWNKTPGAKKYNLYIWDTNTKEYIKLATTKGTSYVVKNARAGAKIYYTVTAVDAYGNEGNYDYSGIIGVYVPGVKVSGVTNDAKGIKISWKKSAVTKTYRLYRKVNGDKKWASLADITNGNNYYIDSKAKSGTVYEYMVRPYKVVAKKKYFAYADDSYSKKSKLPSGFDLPAKRYVDLGWNVDPRESWGPADYCKGTTKVNTKYWTYHNTYKGDSYKPKAGDIITYGVPDKKGVTYGHVDICVTGYDSSTGTFGVITGNWGGEDFTKSGIYYVSKKWSTHTGNKKYYRTICNIYECKLPANKRDILVQSAYNMKAGYEKNPSHVRNKILDCKRDNWCDVFVAYAIYIAK